MNTRRKNKSAHPGIPDMTPLQLSSAGLSRTSNTRRPSGKKLTKDQQIALLQDQLHTTQQLFESRTHSNPHTVHNDQMEAPPDAGGDTDPATEPEETYVPAGSKRKAGGSASLAPRLKRSRAIDPFASSSMVHSGATGLVDDWRLKIQSPRSTATLESPPFDFDLRTPGRNTPLPYSPMASTSMGSMSTLSSLSFEENPLPTFTLMRIIGKARVYPGVKDLPEHMQKGFRDEFIRFVIQQVAISQSPWTNPSIDSFQAMYQIVYPIFPARIRHSDAVHHPTTSALGVLRNHLASAAVTAVQRHLASVFRKKRLDTIQARAKYIAQLFKSEKDHPIIWREYVEGDIENHPEVGGYKTTRRGVFQSDPILETLLSYYSSSAGLKESPPAEDPGVGNRPVGVLALVAAAVERAYKLYATGDFVLPSQQFSSDSWGPKTAQFMDHIVNDLNEKNWNSLFNALCSFSVQAAKEEARRNGIPEGSYERFPLPQSDPPSPAPAHDE